MARVDVLECQYICVDGTGECAVKVDGVDVNIYENGDSDGKKGRMSVSINICIKVGELLYGGLFWCCAIHAP